MHLSRKLIAFLQFSHLTPGMYSFKTVEEPMNICNYLTDPATLAISTLNARTANAPRRSTLSFTNNVDKKFS